MYCAELFIFCMHHDASHVWFCIISINVAIEQQLLILKDGIKEEQ